MTDEEKGQQLLTAVERLVASNGSIRTTVVEARARVVEKAPELTKKKDSRREATAVELIRTFSNRAAIAGGAAGLPALIPGIGSLAAGIAGAFAELAYVLKTEVELCLALMHVYDFDIDDPKERQLAFLLASVGTSQAQGNMMTDLLKAEGVAIWNYGPRRLAGLIIQQMSALALAWVWRGLLRMVPFVGIGVGATMNKVLTQRVGDRVMRDLRTRRDMLDNEPPPGAKVKRQRRAKTAARPKLKIA